MDSKITHAEMTSAVGTETVYNKRNKSTRDINVINKHRADDRKATVSKSDEKVCADNVKIGVDEKYNPGIPKMILKHNDL